MLKNIKLFFKDVLDVSKLTKTQNKKIKILFLVILLNFQILFDILIILYFSKFFSQVLGINNILLEKVLAINYIFPIVIFLRYLFTYLEKKLTTKLRFDIENNLKIHLLKQIYIKGNLSISDAYYYVNIISEQVGSFYATIAVFLSSLVQIVVFSIYLSISNITIFAIFIGSLVLISIPSFFLTKFGRKNADIAYIESSNISKELEKVLDNLFLIKILNRSAEEIEKYSVTLSKYFKARLNEINSGTAVFILPVFLTLITLSFLILNNLGIGFITFDFIGVLIRLFQSLGILNKNGHVLTAYHVYLEKLYLFEEINNNSNINNFSIETIDKVNAVTFNEVFFNYFGSEENLFNNLNFSIKKNNHTIITGPNGSGKSTLIGLITGVLYPTNGKIETFSNKFGYVSAKPMILNDTLINNLLYGNSSNISKEELLSYVKLFKLFDKVDEKIFEKKVSNKSLSSGQMQKVSFIRALANNIDILILDEATSNLDTETKTLIYQILEKLELTIINSTHSGEDLINYDAEIQIYFDKNRRKVRIL